MIAAIAIVGKSANAHFEIILLNFCNFQSILAITDLGCGAQNSPLFIKTFVPDTGLKFHYIVHSSLDVIEERVGKKMLVTGDKYLGLLYPTEEFKVYGYVTMTRVKFILALDDNANPKDADVKQFCTKFHALYVDAISNPFYTLDDKIDSKKFEKEVSLLVAAGL